MLADGVRWVDREVKTVYWGGGEQVATVKAVCYLVGSGSGLGSSQGLWQGATQAAQLGSSLVSQGHPVPTHLQMLFAMSEQLLYQWV